MNAVRHHRVGNRLVSAYDGPEALVSSDLPFDFHRLARHAESKLERPRRKPRPDDKPVAGRLARSNAELKGVIGESHLRDGFAEKQGSCDEDAGGCTESPDELPTGVLGSIE